MKSHLQTHSVFKDWSLASVIQASIYKVDLQRIPFEISFNVNSWLWYQLQPGESHRMPDILTVPVFSNGAWTDVLSYFSGFFFCCFSYLANIPFLITVDCSEMSFCEWDVESKMIFTDVVTISRRQTGLIWKFMSARKSCFVKPNSWWMQKVIKFKRSLWKLDERKWSCSKHSPFLWCR